MIWNRLNIQVLCLIFTLLVFAAPASAKGWRLLVAKYSVLCYQTDEDLETFNKEIDFGGDGGGFLFFGGSSNEGPAMQKEVRRKLDRLVEKVQLILDMRKPFPRVRIELHPNAESLQQAYFRLYKKKKEIRAWFTFKRNTIYLNAEDIFSGMVAHELAHCVVDHYLSVRPPRATAEILARFVDQHLYEEAKTY